MMYDASQGLRELKQNQTKSNDLEKIKLILSDPLLSNYEIEEATKKLRKKSKNSVENTERNSHQNCITV